MDYFTCEKCGVKIKNGRGGGFIAPSGDFYCKKCLPTFVLPKVKK